MASYESFAAVYDLFMDNIDYDSWAAYLKELLCENGVKDGLVLELGCGTGNITQRLAADGYEMIGADISADMLEVARQKQVESDLDIFYIQQDMRSFELYGTVRAVISLCDSMNYILEENELLTVFRLVNNYLDPGGIFIFDLNTCRKYEKVGDATIAENRDEASFIWENDYDSETQINEYDLTLFIEGEDGRYDRFEEIHTQRAWPVEKICRLIKESGLALLAVYDAFTHEPPTKESKRIYVLALEQEKEGA